MQKLPKSLILSVLGFSLLVSCGSTNQQNRTVSIAPLEQNPLSLPPPTVLSLEPVEWVVITEDNVDSVIADNSVIFGLPEQGYKNLTSNLNDFRSFMQEQQVIIATYKRFYSTSDTPTR